MEITLRISSVPSSTPCFSSPFNEDSRFQLRGGKSTTKLCAISSDNGSCSNRGTKRVQSLTVSSSAMGSHLREILNNVRPNSVVDVNKKRSSLESLFCYDKPVPEEIIEKPVGLSLAEKRIGENPRCLDCQSKGAVLCPTCSGSGLYVDAILESQGIIVKVRCLGCGGTGNTMCSGCGGRGHIGAK